jgi:hypothetical protein
MIGNYPPGEPGPQVTESGTQYPVREEHPEIEVEKITHDLNGGLPRLIGRCR